MAQQTQRLTKKQRRELRDEQSKPNSLHLKIIQPKTDNQKLVFDYFDDYNLLLHGLAGTGKSFLSMYHAFDAILKEKLYDQLVIVRSAVPTRDVGFQPGNLAEKMRVYEQPYYSICTELFNRGDAYDVLKGHNQVKFISTSYVRGITFDHSIIFVDECQNLSMHELDSIITRIGQNCKIIFSGDYKQSDLLKDNEKRGILQFNKILKCMSSFKTIEFKEDDIVRSAIVKSYLIAKSRLEGSKEIST